jgi:hypothetical protein
MVDPEFIVADEPVSVLDVSIMQMSAVPGKFLNFYARIPEFRSHVTGLKKEDCGLLQKNLRFRILLLTGLSIRYIDHHLKLRTIERYSVKICTDLRKMVLS